MRVAMIGTGYVGLVSGACFADFGHEVVCVDKDKDKIAALTRGEMPIYEPGLNDVVAINARAGRLKFTTELSGAVAEADAVFIAVGTPSRRGDGFADLSFVYDAAREIARALDGFTVVITKSTVPVGTGDEVERIIQEANPSADVVVASNPEFLREGAAIRDFKFPDRIVIGTSDERGRKVLADIYRPLSLNQAPIMFTARRTAELIKYAANAFLATKITFINEMADLAEKVGADVQEVARGIGLDNRIGSKFLHAGPGFGGSCFPKDLRALVHTGEELGVDLAVARAAVTANEGPVTFLLRHMEGDLGGLKDKVIAVWGLAFKPRTDDMREAPSKTLIEALLHDGAHVVAYDPVAMGEAQKQLGSRPGLTYASSPMAAVQGADALVVITEWQEFRSPDFDAVKARLKTPAIFDGRNLYDPKVVTGRGIEYYSIGRKT